MEKRYRIIISGKQLYKEIEISPEHKSLRFGTGLNCDVRVRRGLFFEPVELLFARDENGEWSVLCSDNLYIYVDEVRKLMSIPIHHGMEVEFRYQKTEGTVLNIQFVMDFDYEQKEYNRRYDIASLPTISIGTNPSNQLVLSGPYMNNDNIVLHKKNNEYELKIISTKYGVSHNGNLVADQALIRNGDFFAVANYGFFYKNGCLYTQQNLPIGENGLTHTDSTRRGNYPKFNRNTRVLTKINDEKIEILDPPPIPKKPKNDLIGRLLPSLSMVLISVVMASGGGAFVLFSLVSSVVGIVTGVRGVRNAKKDYEKEKKDRVKKYTNYIDRKKNEIDQARQEEKDILCDKYISERQEIGRLKNFSHDLFDRCREDEDFLEVRLGIGKREAERKIEYKKQERLEVEDELQNVPKELHDQYKYISETPIVCSLNKVNAVGIIGKKTERFEIMKGMILDICARQYHADVKMFFVAEKQEADKITWLRMLPHVQNDILGIHNIVCDDSSRTVIFEYLYKELSLREESKKNFPHIVVFLYDEYGFKSHPLSRFVENAKEIGVTFVFFGDTRADISLGCEYLIQSSEAGKGTLIDTKDSKKEKEFTYNLISDSDMHAMVQLLAPVYTEEISLEGSLTKNISLFELLHILAVEDVNLAQRWNAAKVYQSMAAPIGVAKSGMILLDLHDKAHGPHGLVAGTTGSGKSELLQTYILSMAALYHPYEVGFVIIDFKGGGMANQFKDLPHMMGRITNIDGKEINRSLRSIKAELNKRQRLFAEAGVNHIDNYIIKVRKGEVKIPLPHLILIVDEFAELKAEQPDFMKELISAARIGRSLGVHLILATQKPSGQVDEQIWSNSRFKLCLKVQSPQDSNEVLKSPLAAEIKEPGRAYLQVGNNEMFELFQSAYSGAPERTEDSNLKEFTIYEITSSGKRLPVYVQKKKKEQNVKTQLDAMVQYMASFCQKNQLKKLPEICLPSLEECIEFPIQKASSDKSSHIVAEIGIYDDPDNQLQDVYSVDLTNQNMMIIGSAQTGKTNLLQTLIRSVTTKYTPQDVNIYIIDFASMYLKNFETLNHVGGVVTASEDEKLKNLFKLLYKEIAFRKEKILSLGVSSFSAYCEAGNTDMPHIVLIIDNLTMLNELYLLDNDMLLPICREGLAVGITVVVANQQTSGIGYKYMSNFECKIAMNCNDNSEYSALFGYCQIRPSDNPGRALAEWKKEILETQIYVPFAGEKEYEKIQNINAFIENINAKYYSTAKAAAIPAVPEFLDIVHYENQYGRTADTKEFALGIDYSDIEPVKINWKMQMIFAISGGMQKQGFYNYMKHTFVENQYSLYIIDDYTGSFEDVSTESNVCLYSRSIEDTEEILEDFKTELERRSALRELNGMNEIEKLSPFILLVHSEEWISYMNENRELVNVYNDILKRGKGLKCCVIFTNLENVKIPSYNAPDVLKPFVENPQYLVFEDLRDIKLFEPTIAWKQKYDKRLRDGEAFVLKGNDLYKIRTIE